jgi:hypothetical protein
MQTLELDQFDANPEWRTLLAAYDEQHASCKVEWIPRLIGAEGIPAEQLSSIHGKLIALGLLTFELGSRTDGVLYQVTTLGKQALLPQESRQLVPEWCQADPTPSAA